MSVDNIIDQDWPAGPYPTPTDAAESSGVFISEDYVAFLTSKRVAVQPSGFDVQSDKISSKLFPHQRAIVQWSVKQGRAAVFANVGLGKTRIQLEYARLVQEHTGKPVLILCPLAVAPQTIREGQEIGVTVKRVFSQEDVGDAPISITNYDNVHKFEADKFAGVILDESSILKHYSKTFFALVEQWQDTPFKLCCTATPAPNEYVEFGNHSMFLGIMHFKDMMARWFIGEGDVARVSRLKHYARSDFWRWLTSWAVCISKPSDLGMQYDMSGYDLPALHIHEHRLRASDATIQRSWSEGRLIPDDAPSATKFMKVKRESLDGRIEKSQEIVSELGSNEPVILWCDTDFEADALKAAFPEAREVRGSHTTKHKEDVLTGFSEGAFSQIITKPEIAGFGLNWQHCANMIFVGVSFSFERWYQALGRIYRFGQKRDVNIHLIYSETEGNVAQVLKTKRIAFAEMQAKMNAAMHEHGLLRSTQNPAFVASGGDVPIILPDWLRSQV